MSFYLYLDNQNQGPLTLGDLTQKLAAGQISLETPCCKEGDPAWQTVAQFISVPPMLPGAVPPSTGGAGLDSRFGHATYLIRRKLFTFLGDAFRIFDPAGNLVFFSKQKAFKLKEDFRIYTGEDMKTEVLTIKAKKLLDIASPYEVMDPTTGQKVGGLRRKGLKSILRDEWLILDSSDREIGLIQEDSMAMALVRRIIPFADLIPQNYHAKIGETTVCVFKQNFNPFSLKITADFTPDSAGLFDRRLGIAAVILLRAIEGKQG